jgi:hypothetical protein
MINECGTVVGIKIGGGNRRTRSKLEPLPLSPCSEVFVRNLFIKWAFKIYVINPVIMAGHRLGLPE